MNKLLYPLALLFVLSCSSKSFPDEKWENRQWTLVEMLSVPVQTSGSSQDANLVFDHRTKTITGTGGCNRIYGPYTDESKRRLKFGNLGMTRMACQDTPFENRFTEVLYSVRCFEVSGNQLLLKNGKEDVILRFQ
jgi:heat shock protein HslJ